MVELPCEPESDVFGWEAFATPGTCIVVCIVMHVCYMAYGIHHACMHVELSIVPIVPILYLLTHFLPSFFPYSF